MMKLVHDFEQDTVAICTLTLALYSRSVEEGLSGHASHCGG